MAGHAFLASKGLVYRALGTSKVSSTGAGFVRGPSLYSSNLDIDAGRHFSHLPTRLLGRRSEVLE